MTTSTSPAASRPRNGLGTFAGVFTPSILTILGLILFRRLGYVVGEAGIVQALVVIALANAISIVTSTSLAAIATNIRVKGGGDYYLISRSLGADVGGALGVVLFLAQAVSVAFYCMGLAEAVSLLAPDSSLPPAGIAIATTLVLFVFAWLGADWATRLQFVIMIALVLGIGSFFVGAAGSVSLETLSANWNASGGTLPFWTLFALFFPAVTGFTQGVSMSGDLADPGSSIPGGTFWAVAVSLVVYVAAAFLFAASLPASALAADYDAFHHVAWSDALASTGLVAATVSSAMASFLGAPRILQAVAADRALPALERFAKGHGPANNPRAAVLLTLAIALAVESVGGIDAIAPIVSMFFLISYGLLNHATALEARAASPSFRPRFRWFHWRLSLVGAIACAVAMVMIDPFAAAAAGAILIALQQYIARYGGMAGWADSQRDVFFQRVRTNLQSMAAEPVHPRNWRPHLLVFTESGKRSRSLTRFGVWIEGGAGLTTVVRIRRGGPGTPEELAEAERELAREVHAEELEVSVRVVAARDLEESARVLVQSWGLGPIRANTILLNWLDHVAYWSADEEARSAQMYVQTLQAAVALERNVVVLKSHGDDWTPALERTPTSRRIDVWWADTPSGRLMLLLAYMMTRAKEWRRASIRVLAWSRVETREKTAERLRTVLAEVRIDAEVEILTDLTADVLAGRCEDASIVFLPLRFRRERIVDPFNERIEGLLERLPAVALVAAGQDVDLEAEPEREEFPEAAEPQPAAAAEESPGEPVAEAAGD